MKKKNSQKSLVDTKIISFSSTALLLSIGFAMAVPAYVLASTDTGVDTRTEYRNSDRREAIEQALAEGNYDAWIQAMHRSV